MEDNQACESSGSEDYVIENALQHCVQSSGPYPAKLGELLANLHISVGKKNCENGL